MAEMNIITGCSILITDIGNNSEQENKRIRMKTIKDTKQPYSDITPVSKYFHELNTKELYEILKSRSEIFVVEQNCIYQDMDDIDYRSLHIFYQSEGKIIAYLRAFEKDSSPKTVQIGRVLTLTHGIGLGGKLLKEGLSIIKEKMNPSSIYIEAQCYATGFYEREGFIISSPEFLEDGIPHVEMLLNVN